MARPCKLDTVEFQRKLKDPERAILLTAGQGDLTRGFHLLLSVYRVLHEQGFKPDMPLDCLTFSENVYSETS